jgi:OmpA-OmpF porin, OOP family
MFHQLFFNFIMKNLKFILSIIVVISLSTSTQAQFIDKLAKKAEKKVEREAEKRTEKRVNKGIDNVFDGVEEGIDETVDGDPNKKDDSKKETETKKTDEKNNTSSDQTKSKTNTNKQDNSVGEVKQEPVLVWNKYDFIPGTEIIFEDDFVGESNGEFPSRWDVTKGTVEIANWGGENVVWLKKTNSNGPDAILPYLKNRAEDYLPDEFTIEMDVYFHSDFHLNSDYYVFLYDSKNQMKILSPSKPIRITFNQITYDLKGDTYPEHDKMKPKEGWRHVAISFNKRVLKGYLDDMRLVNIPNIEFNPTGVMISAHNVSGNGKPFVKNVRIAKGAVPLYDKFLTDGKFITTGIKFDVAKATIKPESMGTINYVVKMMQDHPELKFSVEGHTDSDGADAANQSLSEARAKAVKETMIKAGISADRLTSKGHGETKPMAGNDTPEGKAQNRRVEFVKI